MSTEATLDGFGRIVIPKKTRRHFGLEPGSVLEVNESDDGILLKPASQEAPLKLEAGVLVFSGKAGGDLEGAIRRHRDERASAIRSVTKK